MGYSLAKRTGVCETCGITYVNVSKPAKRWCTEHRYDQISESMKGKNNPVHKMDREKFLKLQREKIVLAHKAIEDNKEEVSRKKSEAMGRAIDRGFRPQDNAGWGGGGSPSSKNHVEYMGATMSQEMYDHLNKE